MSVNHPARNDPTANPPRLDYATPTGTDVADVATRSLVWGLILFLPFLPGLLAIAYARQCARRSPDRLTRGRARAGLVLGIANLALWCVLGVLSIPLIAHVEQQARRATCLAQLGQVGLELLLYANDNRGRFPARLSDLAGKRLPAQALMCPEAQHNSAAPVTTGPQGCCSYVYLIPPPMGRIPRPSQYIIAHDPLRNHGGKGIAILYGDFHVQWHDASVAARILNELAASHNPPRPRVAPLN